MTLNPALLIASALLLLVPVASADPPAGSTANCIGGYNPDAVLNVCLEPLLTTPGNTGTVGTTQGPCIIGQICAPVPTYTPSGGTPIPTVTVPSPAYVAVNVPGVIFCETPYAGEGGDGKVDCEVADSFWVSVLGWHAYYQKAYLVCVAGTCVYR